MRRSSNTLPPILRIYGHLFSGILMGLHDACFSIVKFVYLLMNVYSFIYLCMYVYAIMHEHDNMLPSLGRTTTYTHTYTHTHSHSRTNTLRKINCVKKFQVFLKLSSSFFQLSVYFLSSYHN